MKAILTFLQILLFCSLSYGVVIFGFLTDSISGEPVDSAIFRFRIGENPDAYPTAQSDSNGFFRKEEVVPEGYPLNIVIDKNGYISKALRFSVVSDSIDLGTITINRYSEAEITFSGTVIDSMTQMPLSGVRITLKKNIGDITPYKFFTTDSSGSFNQVISVSNNTSLLTSISHPGYYPKGLETTMFTNSVNHIIRLQPEGSLRIKLSGQVLDSISGMPVGNAKIIIATTFSSLPDTSYTDSDGRFIRFVEADILASQVRPEIYCTIYSDDYTKKNAIWRISVTFPYSDVDLEEIFISKNNSLTPSGLQHAKMTAPFEHSKDHSVLTLNGRLVSRDNDTRKPDRVSSQTLLRVNKKTNRASEKKLYIKTTGSLIEMNF